MITKSGKHQPSKRIRPRKARVFAQDKAALRVRIDGLGLQASLGIYPSERQQRQAISLDLSWRISRDELLASLSSMSESSLHQHFKALTAMTPLQYQKQMRLHEARRRAVTLPNSATTSHPADAALRLR